MQVVEKLYNIKKYMIKRVKQFYRAYFTIEGTYTSLLPDKIYIKKLYKKHFGKELDLKNPVTFNEKLNWLKLYYRHPKLTMMADKYRVRDYIKEQIGEDYLVPLLGVYDSVEDIDFDSLPNQFVLKCNHDSDAIICKDKSNNDFLCKKFRPSSIEDVKLYLNKRYKTNYYKSCREWPYKNIKRKIICEKYLKNKDGKQLLEYNVFCFNGEPKFFKISTRREDDTIIKAFYSLDWKYLSMSTGDMAGDVFEKPVFIDNMLEISRKLSNEVPHLRVDFLLCNDKLYSGELTMFSAGGFWHVEPYDLDYSFGDYLDLPEKKRRAR